MLVAIDLGGVLVDVDREVFWRTIPAVRRAAVEHVIDHLHHRFQCGELDAPTFLGAMADAAQLPTRQVASVWAGMVRWRKGAVEMLTTMSQLVNQVELWSNIDVVHARALGATMAPLVGSFQLGVCKPDPAFFQRALNGRDPASCRFFDDRADNIAAAQRMGIVATCVSDFSGIPMA